MENQTTPPKEYAETLIEDVFYDRISNGTTVICTLRLFNGTYSIIGESANRDYQSFNMDTAKVEAFNDAVLKLLDIVEPLHCFNNMLADKGYVEHKLEKLRRNLFEDIAAIHEVGLSHRDAETLQYLLKIQEILQDITPDKAR